MMRPHPLAGLLALHSRAALQVPRRSDCKGVLGRGAEEAAIQMRYTYIWHPARCVAQPRTVKVTVRGWLMHCAPHAEPRGDPCIRRRWIVTAEAAMSKVFFEGLGWCVRPSITRTREVGTFSLAPLQHACHAHAHVPHAEHSLLSALTGKLAPSSRSKRPIAQRTLLASPS